MEIRKAISQDFSFFLKLKSEEFNIFWTGGESVPDPEKLNIFFQNAIAKADEPQARKIYMIINETEDVIGHLYLIPHQEMVELSIAISKAWVGNGYGKKAVLLGREEGKKLGFRGMLAYIREDNLASIRTFEACGAKKTGKTEFRYIPRLKKEIKMEEWAYYY